MGIMGAETTGADANDLEGVEEEAQMRIFGYLQYKGTKGSDIHCTVCARYLGLSTAAAHRFAGTQSTINSLNFLRPS